MTDLQIWLCDDCGAWHPWNGVIKGRLFCSNPAHALPSPVMQVRALLPSQPAAVSAPAFPRAAIDDAAARGDDPRLRQAHDAIATVKRLASDLATARRDSADGERRLAEVTAERDGADATADNLAADFDSARAALSSMRADLDKARAGAIEEAAKALDSAAASQRRAATIKADDAPMSSIAHEAESEALERAAVRIRALLTPPANEGEVTT